MALVEEVFRLSGLPSYTFVEPIRYDEIKISSGRQGVVALSKAHRGSATLLRVEQLWPEPRPEPFGAVPNKPTLQFNGAPTWAEFILLRLLEADGWVGAWVKNWGGRAFWRDVNDPVVLTASANARFQQIEKRMDGRGGGCWDIIAARGDEILFLNPSSADEIASD